MPTPNERRAEVQTTLRIDAALHLWIRQYALANGTTLTGIMQELLSTWAKEHGYKEDSGDVSQERRIKAQ